MDYRVLLITPDAKALKKELKELSIRGLSAIGVSNFAEACNLLIEDGTIHVVLSEIEIPLNNNSTKTIKSKDIFEQIKKLRFEVNIFLYSEEVEFSNYETCGLLDGYFCKKDNDYDDIIKKIKNVVLNSKIRAPFYEKLVEYANKAKDSWHTPGHSSGYSIKNSPWVHDYYDFFGEKFFTADVSVSVPMLDSLLHPTGVILEAQELAAIAFGSRYTFFSTNGTSTANKILIQTLVKPGDAILIERNCHKSVHYGVIASGAEPVYLMPSVNNTYGLFGPASTNQVVSKMTDALKAGKHLKALLITSCTYDGLISDVPAIVKEAHKRGIKVIVDEAWFGYANFHREFYPCAMKAGADYATQSTHKTMSAFSQASMIHVQDPDFESIKDFFMENFNMHTSISPQYPIIASLDVARKQMVMEGYSLLQRVIEISENLKKSINSLNKFRVLELDDILSEEVRNDIVRLDKTKLTIDISQSGLSSKEIEHILLTKHNIQIEKSTFNTITVLITIGATYSKLNRLYLALENIEKMSGAKHESDSSKLLKDFSLSLSPMKYLPRAAFYCDGELIPLNESTERVSSVMITPYPPGIPLLVPGQIISKEIMKTLQMYRNYGVEIHGLSEGLISVLTAMEEKKLSDMKVNICN